MSDTFTNTDVHRLGKKESQDDSSGCNGPKPHLRDSERRHRLVIEAMSEGVLQFEADGAVSLCNAAAERIIGQSRDRILGRRPTSDWLAITEDGTPINISDPHLPTAMTFRTGEAQSNFVMGIHRPTGELVWTLVNTQPLKHAGEALPYAVITTLIDITEQKKSEQHHRTLVSTMSEGLVHHSADGTITLCNVAAQQMLGLTKEQMMGRTSLHPYWRVIHEDGGDFPGESHPAMVTLRTGEAQSNVVMGVHKPSGDLTWILVNSQPIFSSGQAAPDGVVVTFTDLTERKVLEDKLRQAALYDALTGLPTRTLLMERLVQASHRAHRDGQAKFAVLFLDLDNFKTINDTFGHDAGDSLLKKVGKLLQGCIREADTAARLGGDEFVVLLEGVTSAAAAVSFAERVLKHLQLGPYLGAKTMKIQASIGIALGDTCTDPTVFLKRADKAMYRAKSKGRGQVAVWSLNCRKTLEDLEV
jgi:diguanylate cyclase (GGDEF)-like protein/PAS domain S-box-containing protein